MLPKLLLALAMLTAMVAVATPAEATSAGFCVLGMCQGVSQPLPPLPVPPPDLGCQTVVSPAVANIQPGTVIVQVCPTT